jgi:hypothetical protein
MEKLERKGEWLVEIITIFGDLEAMDILYHWKSLDTLIY